MFTETAELYDLIYGSLKDYGREVDEIAARLRRLHPAAGTVLDVGCGTGEHARLLAERYGYDVSGIDLSSEFVEIARRKLPDAEFTCADMVSFDLGRRFDVILCLFSGFGYVRSAENAARTLERFAAHLAEGGVVLVEPWFEPGALTDGYLSAQSAEAPGVIVCRMSRTHVHERSSTIEFQYLIGTEAGIRHATERHELGLFTAAEMKGFFEQAGFTVEQETEGLTGRGLYIGRRHR